MLMPTGPAERVRMQREGFAFEHHVTYNLGVRLGFLHAFLFFFSVFVTFVGLHVFDRGHEGRDHDG